MSPADDPAVIDHIRQQLNALMPGRYFILEGHTPVLCTDFLTWATWHDTANRHVAEDCGEGWRLSTVFLGQCVDHGEDRLLLFETALFVDGRMTDVLQRYATWEEAYHGHWVYLGKIAVLLTEGREEEDDDTRPSP